jgi:hypothetical protein
VASGLRTQLSVRVLPDGSEDGWRGRNGGSPASLLGEEGLKQGKRVKSGSPSLCLQGGRKKGAEGEGRKEEGAFGPGSLHPFCSQHQAERGRFLSGEGSNPDPLFNSVTSV